MTTRRFIIRFSAVAALIAVALISWRQIHRDTDADVEVENEDGAQQAAEWFMHQRAFPGKTIPAGAYQAALSEVRRKWPTMVRSAPRSANRNAIATAGGPPVPWTSVGPAPIIYNGATFSGNFDVAGRINTIAIDPTPASNTIYIGAASGGIWKTTNGGTTWAPISDFQCAITMGALAVDPVNPQIVYAGTGEGVFAIDAYQGCGFMRSTNGGSTWTEVGPAAFQNQTGGARINRIIINVPTAGSTTTTILIAATNFGIYRSVNSGQTWTAVATGAGIFTDITVDPLSPNILYAGRYLSGTGGIYKSTDTGLTWTKVTSGLPTSGYARVVLAAAPSASGTVYASFSALDGTLFGVYKTTDFGATWAKIAATGVDCKLQCWYDMQLAVDPTSASIVYFSGFSLYRSIDAGLTFSNIGLTIHVDHHIVAFDPNLNTTIYAGSDGGIFKSVDNGTNWTGLNTTLSITQFYPGISVSPTSATTFLAGAQDNGTTEGGTALGWSSQIGGDGAQTAYDFKTGATFAGLTSGSSKLSPRRRNAGSSVWNVKSTGINTGDNYNWVPPMTMDPRNPSVLYFGTNKVYRTTNSGDGWTVISPDLSNGTGSLTTIAVSAADSQVVYAGTDDGRIQMTTNLGATWAVGSGAPTKYVTKIIVDPLDPRIAYATFSGFTGGHVSKTTTGKAWTDISFNLPNAPVNGIVFQPGTRELDVATDVGVFALAEGATSWVPLMTSLPSVPVIDLVYDGPRGRLVAATHGRGIWTLPVATAVLRGDITAGGTLAADDAQAILSAVVGKALPTNAVRFPNGDANCDGNVTAVDALLVLMKIVGSNTGTACVGTVK